MGLGILACSDFEDSEGIHEPNETHQNEPVRTIAQAMGGVWETDSIPLDLSPPTIYGPVYNCAQSLAVQSIANAVVRVFDEFNNELGSAVASGSGRAHVFLSQPLAQSQMIFANHSANNQTSDLSLGQVVQTYSLGQLPRPRIGHIVYECGRRVSPLEIIPGPQLILEQDQPGNVIGSAWPNSTPTRTDWWPISHDPLPQGSGVRVYQAHCAGGHEELLSPVSDWAPVLAAPSPMPMFDVNQSDVIAGTSSVRVRDTQIGAFAAASQGPAFGAERWAQWTSIVLFGNAGSVIQESPPIDFSQELCERSGGLTITPLPVQTLETLPAPEVLQPICPGATSIRVRASHEGARLHIYRNNQEIAQSDGSTAFSEIQFQNGIALSLGDELRVDQYFEGTIASGTMMTSTSGTATVGLADTFEVSGAQVYKDQDTGDDIEGFVREESRGPLFTLHCCAECRRDEDLAQCYDGPSLEARTATIGILEAGNPIDEVTLHEISPGYFTGRWDWFMATGVTSPWPPQASLEYGAVVLDSPCASEHSESFEILIGQIDSEDTTPPELVQLTITEAGGPSVQLQEGDPNDLLVVSPGVNIQVLLTGRDPDGLKLIELKADSSGFLSSPTVKQSDPLTIPIPSELSLESVISAMEPYDEVEIYGLAENFNDNVAPVETGRVTVRAAHPIPVLSAVDPGQVYSGMELELSGEDLKYGSLNTTVHFSLQPADGSNSISAQAQDPAGHSGELTVDIPSEFAGIRGIVSVWVDTSHGSHTQTSNILTFELLDRNQGTFAGFDMTDLFVTSGGVPSCVSSASPAPGAITDVQFNQIYQNPPIYDVTISANGHSNQSETIRQQVLGSAHEAGPANVGGVVIGPDCRTAVVLSVSEFHSDFQANEYRFIISIYHFPAETSNPVVYRTFVPVDLAIVKDQSWIHMPQLFRIFISQDDTLVALGGTATSPSSNAAIRLWGRFADMHLDSALENMTSSCSFQSPCEISSTIDGSAIYIHQDSSQYGYWDLQDEL